MSNITESHQINGMKFEVKWCELCQGFYIICPKCGNNSCNGTYGTVNDEKCDICPIAYEIMYTIEKKLNE